MTDPMSKLETQQKKELVEHAGKQRDESLTLAHAHHAQTTALLKKHANQKAAAVSDDNLLDAE